MASNSCHNNLQLLSQEELERSMAMSYDNRPHDALENLTQEEFEMSMASIAAVDQSNCRLDMSLKKEEMERPCAMDIAASNSRAQSCMLQKLELKQLEGLEMSGMVIANSGQHNKLLQQRKQEDMERYIAIAANNGRQNSLQAQLKLQEELMERSLQAMAQGYGRQNSQRQVQQEETERSMAMMASNGRQIVSVQQLKQLQEEMETSAMAMARSNSRHSITLQQVRQQELERSMTMAANNNRQRMALQQGRQEDVKSKSLAMMMAIHPEPPASPYYRHPNHPQRQLLRFIPPFTAGSPVSSALPSTGDLMINTGRSRSSSYINSLPPPPGFNSPSPPYNGYCGVADISPPLHHRFSMLSSESSSSNSDRSTSSPCSPSPPPPLHQYSPSLMNKLSPDLMPPSPKSFQFEEDVLIMDGVLVNDQISPAFCCTYNKRAGVSTPPQRARSAETSPGSPSSFYITDQLCNSWDHMTGTCRLAAQCQYAHAGWDEVRQRYLPGRRTYARSKSSDQMGSRSFPRTRDGSARLGNVHGSSTSTVSDAEELTMYTPVQLSPNSVEFTHNTEVPAPHEAAPHEASPNSTVSNSNAAAEGPQPSPNSGTVSSTSNICGAPTSQPASTSNTTTDECIATPIPRRRRRLPIFEKLCPSV